MGDFFKVESIFMSENETYLSVIQKIEETQEEKGDAGCFAELYPALRSAATLLMIYRGPLGESELEKRVKALGEIASSLPDLHDETILLESYAKIRELTA